MDWSKFTDKLKPLKEKAMPILKKASPILEKAKEAGFKAMDYTQKQLQNTPIVLKTIEEFTDLRSKKRVIVIAYDQKHPDAREILLRSPLWGAQAWTDAAELRFIETSRESELISHLSINTPVDMRVWYIGDETFHLTDIQSILKWWETRCYDGKNPQESKENPDTPQENTSEPVDPLAGK